ncbi:SDR family oxidoreductase [Alicyclobacillus macrosporangiidus]|uniref:NAD(P)-dependent dehydrogenase, short-chain alcohol dehydrogenase family n=1 Tax=Alicyclobacillus macrosporangiidus TaxID=392015 RepID=A0A1I7KXB5_9BACL|nr:SDR family oxidoreductase [Alicyclobacillus macrosporangiidus]SFV01956.1 NAD(P)-dependent dehydrogenase, short-chain alcohol dehydrogenase family [Alicyclobacillus macrosporangiidus]
MRIETYRDLFDLSAKTAIVTGGLGILGRHFCTGLAEFGARVAVIDLNEAEVEQFSKELEQRYGTLCIGVPCDVSSPLSVQRMVQRVAKVLGPIQILVNNAASKSNDLQAFFAPFENYTLEQWRKVTSVNLDGMFLVAQAVGKHMIEHGRGGSIVQTSSIYGLMGPDDRIYEGSNYLGGAINTPAVYAATKAGVIGLTKYLATRWAKHGIRVNTLIPGGVESGQNHQFLKNYAHRVPMQRMAQPRELVGAVLFLASEASSYVTGHNLIVDGGLHAW